MRKRTPRLPVGLLTKTKHREIVSRFGNLHNPISDNIACAIDLGWIPADKREEGHIQNIKSSKPPRRAGEPDLVAVARSVSKAEMKLTPRALEAMDAEWERLRKIKTWMEDQVKEWSVVRDKAREDGETVHIGRLFPILVEKNSELAEGDPQRKFKGRVVFDGSFVRDQDKNVALFQELSCCPATMQALSLIHI